MAFLVDKRERLKREETYLNDEIETAKEEQVISAKKRELFATKHPGIIKAAQSAGRFGSNVATGIVGLAASEIRGSRRASRPRVIYVRSAPRRRRRVSYIRYAPRRRHRRSSNSGGGILNAHWG